MQSRSKERGKERENLKSRQRWVEGVETSKHTAARLFPSCSGIAASPRICLQSRIASPARLCLLERRGIAASSRGRLQLAAETQFPPSHPQVVHAQLLDQCLGGGKRDGFRMDEKQLNKAKTNMTVFVEIYLALLQPPPSLLHLLLQLKHLRVAKEGQLQVLLLLPLCLLLLLLLIHLGGALLPAPGNQQVPWQTQSLRRDGVIRHCT